MTRVAILLFDDVDLLDVGGPYEVFLTATRLTERSGETAAFDVITVSADGQPVSAYGDMGLVPTMAVDEMDAVDVIVIPGAIAIEEVCARPSVQDAVTKLIDRSQLATSVCTGAFLLGDRGLLDGLTWTTHHEDMSTLGARLESSDGATNARWVDTGDVITSGGLSSGIAMALHLVERLHGRDLAIRTAAQIEYVWDPDDGIITSTT